jgi:RpiB/LacA/LacB family sugar-phosphate isomerase
MIRRKEQGMKLAVSSPKVCSLTEAVHKHLAGKGMEMVLLGALAGRQSDYISAAEELAEAVSSGACSLGVLFCHTGTGATLIANKFPGVRAALCPDAFSSRVARGANNANVLVLGIRLTGEALALEILEAFLEPPAQDQPKWPDFHRRTDAIDQRFRKR